MRLLTNTGAVTGFPRPRSLSFLFTTLTFCPYFITVDPIPSRTTSHPTMSGSQIETLSEEQLQDLYAVRNHVARPPPAQGVSVPNLFYSSRSPQPSSPHHINIQHYNHHSTNHDSGSMTSISHDPRGISPVTLVMLVRARREDE